MQKKPQGLKILGKSRSKFRTSAEFGEIKFYQGKINFFPKSKFYFMGFT